MSEQIEKITAARDYIQARTQIRPQIAVILGSGLGALADEVQVDATFPYSEIPGFPVSTVAGHAGQLVLGTLVGKNVVIMQGRFHYYEGYPMPRIIFPIRVMHALGANSLIVTNAAGGLNPDFDPGDVMLITDHINTMGDNPLIGPNDEEIGPRFPDMTHTYTPDLRNMAINIANSEGILVRQGVYVATSGPTYETPAERRYLRSIGGDAVGMSTVPEATVANHAGMHILGLSAITNKATGDADQQADSHEEVLAMAKVAGEKLVRLVREVIEAMPILEYVTPDQLVEIIDNNMTQIAHVFDHTLLKPDAIAQQITQLCQEAMEYNFASVCINPTHVKLAADLLKDSHVKVCTVIGFPLGASTSEDKIRETQETIADGATEVDMVINIGALKEGNDKLVEQDIAGVVQAAHSRGVLCKVIIETALLTDEEKVRVCHLAKNAGADFVKTSTGFSSGGATAEDVALMRQTVGPNLGVKASGGIKTLADAKNMIAAGANRIGTSTGVMIVQEAQAS
ncbi:purine-nucleoside phosphorylase [Anaerolineales bacterium HSG24]|nr:purine-nucleoside phosphorylase [Anaerolineales bacterium HSG24]